MPGREDERREVDARAEHAQDLLSHEGARRFVGHGLGVVDGVVEPERQLDALEVRLVVVDPSQEVETVLDVHERVVVPVGLGIGGPETAEQDLSPVPRDP